MSIQSAKIIPIVLALLLAALALIFYYQSSSKNNNHSSKEIQFEKIEESVYSESPTEKKNLVINSPDEWQKLNPNSSTNIDFNQNTIIAVFAGPKSTGGYSIQVEKITDPGQNIVVNVRETSPGTNCLVTQALTDPRQIIKTE